MIPKLNRSKKRNTVNVMKCQYLFFCPFNRAKLQSRLKSYGEEVVSKMQRKKKINKQRESKKEQLQILMKVSNIIKLQYKEKKNT